MSWTSCWPETSLQDAIAFARAIQADLGGELRTHARFGTAQWLAPSGIAVDFASARQRTLPAPRAIATSATPARAEAGPLAA